MIITGAKMLFLFGWLCIVLHVHTVLHLIVNCVVIFNPCPRQMLLISKLTQGRPLEKNLGVV